MIQQTSTLSLKQSREIERKAKEEALREKCNAYVLEKYGEQEIVRLSNANKGLWFLPVMSEDDPEQIEKIGLMKPIDRNVLNIASSKVEDAGVYGFIEQCMRECFVGGDPEIIEVEEYFIHASQAFNKILDSRKAYLLKR